jgi:hypothetical protein
MTDDIRTRALDPIVQSAVGIVRESAGLLYHIAGFGIALVSSPRNSRPKHSTGRTRLVTPADTNIIAFPSSKCRATVQRSCRNGS